jgi:hypothetical protein
VAPLSEPWRKQDTLILAASLVIIGWTLRALWAMIWLGR